MKIRHWETPLQNVAPGQRSEQDLSGRPAMLKLNYTCRKPNQNKNHNIAQFSTQKL